MFGFLKSKRTDPAAIAAVVFRVSQDPELFAQCHQEFALSSEDRQRASFSAVLFVYCCSHYWASSKNDSRVVAACAHAAEIIPQCFRDPDRFVRVGDYLISPFEVPLLLTILETHFQQRIPIPAEATSDPENLGAAIHTVVSNHQVHLATLVKAVLLLRQERFAKDIESTAHLKDIDVTFMVLADNFGDQVNGITLLDVSHDPRLATDRQMRGLRGSVILHEYFRRVVAELDAL
jgi:hypothetical protein